jgi:hypothetical protein
MLNQLFFRFSQGQRKRLWSGKPEPGYVFERVTITGGKYITAAASVALGIKDKPIRLTSLDGYGQQIRSIAAKNILFYDSGDRRGWLVDGASALLHLARSSLALDDSNGFPITRKPLKEAETNIQGRKAAISVLNNDHNRNLRLYVNKQRNWQDVTIKPDGTPEVSEKQEITYFELQHRVDDIFHILNLIQTHQENKISSDGIGFKVRLSPRRQLEGFDFHDIARGKEPMWSRATSLKARGKGWVDFVRAIDAITLFGKGFGELMEMPQGSTEICAAWRQVPIGQDYLAVSTEALKNILLEEPPSSGPLRVVDDIYWHTPDKSFEPCRCVAGKPCDRVQVLLPTGFPWLWGRGYRSPQALPSDGAVIFGHSWKLPLRWKDYGDPTEDSPDEDDLDVVSNDSAIGLAGSSRTSQDRLSHGPQTGAVDADHRGVRGWSHSAVQRLKKIGNLRKFKPLGQGSSKSSSSMRDSS